MNSIHDQADNEPNFSHIRWSSHYLVESTPNELNVGDKIVLPPTALEQMLSQVGHAGTLPSPLTFELRHPHTGATIHSGVKEFSSDVGTVQLPMWMKDALGLSDQDHVLIKLQLLPKGIWTRLKPISHDYRDITDYRAALEAHLRGHYNTLTKGQMLTCRYGGRTYDFQVMELKPQDAVSITDTDLEVDMDPIQPISTENTLDSNDGAKTSAEKSRNVKLKEIVSNAPIPYRAYAYWTLHLNDQQAADQLAIEVTVESGDADIVISSQDNRSPTLDNHEWSDLLSNKEKFIPLDHLTSSKVHVGIHGYAQNTIVSWQSTQVTPSNEAMDIVSEHEDTDNKVQCKNCHAWIADRTAVLHEGFCYRNNTVCPWGCGKVFKKNSLELEEHWHCDQCDFIGTVHESEKHVAYFHTQKSCVCTSFTASSFEALAQHRRSTCAEKLITCRYCHTLTAQGPVSLDPRDRLLGLHSHESYCGSRTITCQKCNKPIPIKDIQVHAKIHEVKRQQQVLPPTCSNRNCIRPKATNRNKLSFCQFCFGPFWITEDDPKNVKLIQRIARKIHSQLTVGCGNDWCRNKYCATSTKEVKDATTAASLLIPMIKSLPRELALPNPDPHLYFCVDEATTRKKFLAEMLCDSLNSKYELGWCVIAIENEQEDLDRAKSWLDRNAPRKNYSN